MVASAKASVLFLNGMYIMFRARGDEVVKRVVHSDMVRSLAWRDVVRSHSDSSLGL